MPEPIIVEQDFEASAERLWNAITVQDEMVQWYFAEIANFKPVLGHEVEFVVSVEDRNFVHQWKITEVLPGKRISYSWKYDGIDGEGAVTWEVWENARGSALRLTSVGIESFPKDDPLFTREAAEQGWSYFVNDRLKSYIDG